MIDKSASLSNDVLAIVDGKGTEYPNTGAYNCTADQGTYLCRRCGLALFRSSDKFLSSCGWPSFDDEIADSIKRLTDKDDRRTEILCNRCDAHLGHVFIGEGLTDKNLRHCVNSGSLDFVTDLKVIDTEEAIVAGGCFWGVEHHLGQIAGVLKVESGYSGGHVEAPSYSQVCRGRTGHLEAVRVLFDPARCSYEDVLKTFFEIHDPSQGNGQGPDIGSQYHSAVFCYDDEQKGTAQKLICILLAKGLSVATKLCPASVFWPADEGHQAYYQKNGKQPYCHRRIQRF